MSPRAAVIPLTLLAALASGAPSAGAASTQARYMTCTKAAKVDHRFTGAYNDPLCKAANAAGDGHYALAAVTTPYAFTVNAKGATFYYHPAHEAILWQVRCAKGEVKGVITGPATSAETIVYESCVARSQAGQPKHAECLGHLTATIETALVELLPGGATGVVMYPGFTSPFSCEGVAFARMEGFEVAAVENAGKGPLASFAASPSTGEPALTEFFDFEEGETFTAALQGAVNGSPLLDVALQAAIPLGPKKELVIRQGAA